MSTSRIALVAGATRGAGRGIATALGEAGYVVYCTGRSSRAVPSSSGRPETIEETAERVTAAGGHGVPVRVDHHDEEQVAALCRRIREEHGGLDVLVNDIWGGDHHIEFGVPVWEMSIPKARAMLDTAIFTHLVTTKHASPLLFGRERPLLVEVTDGDTFGYRGMVAYDLVKMAIVRLAFIWSRELGKKGVTALAVTPGFLRSEEMLERFGVTEATYRDATVADFVACSETPLFVGRAVAALAGDPDVAKRAGRVFASWTLAREYGFVDADGARPDWGAYFERTYGKTPEADYTSWMDGPFEVASGYGTDT